MFNINELWNVLLGLILIIAILVLLFIVAALGYRVIKSCTKP